MRGLPTAVGSIGLLSSSINGLEIVFKALLDSNPWMNDAETLEMPWHQDKYDAIAARNHSPGRVDGRLVFGLLRCDNYVQPHPTIDKAIQTVRQALQHHGHEVSLYPYRDRRVLMVKQIVDWQPPPQNEAVGNLVCQRLAFPFVQRILNDSSSGSSELRPVRPSAKPSRPVASHLQSKSEIGTNKVMSRA